MKKLILAAAAATLPAAAFAFEPVGGSLDVSYGTALTSTPYGADTDLQKMSLKGSYEGAFTNQFSVQGDLGLNEFDALANDGKNVAVHGIYHAMPNLSFGAFVGYEDVDSSDWTYYGLEAGQDFGQFAYEASFATGDEAGIDINIYDVKGEYVLNDQITLGARVGYLDGEAFNVLDFNATRLAVSASYQATDELAFYGELGNADIDIDGLGSESENYLTVGARFTFGGERGATFEQRGLQDFLPFF